MIYFLAESILVLFEFATVIIGLLTIYLIRHLPPHPYKIDPKVRRGIIWSSIFCLLIAVASLALTHIAIVFTGTLQAFLILSVGLLAGVSLYFYTLADHVDGTPIRHVLFVWITLAVSLAALLGIISWGSWRGSHLLAETDFLQLGTVVAPAAQMAGILIAALGLVVANLFMSQQERKSSARTIYQALEFGAIELFRFEKANPELVQILWYGDSRPDSSTERGQQLAHHLEQYVCQYLNLYEMALRLRTDEVVPPEVFASWVPWMYEVCGLKVFAELWREDLRPHYIRSFRQLIDQGIECAENDDDTGLSEKAERFYRSAAAAVNPRAPCQAVLRWLVDARKATVEVATAS